MNDAQPLANCEHPLPTISNDTVSLIEGICRCLYFIWGWSFPALRVFSRRTDFAGEQFNVRNAYKVTALELGRREHVTVEEGATPLDSGSGKHDLHHRRPRKPQSEAITTFLLTELGRY